MRNLRGWMVGVLGVGAIQAQGLWDGSFHVIGGRGGSAATQATGRSEHLGASWEGAHPLPEGFGQLVVEAGYRKFLNRRFTENPLPEPLPDGSYAPVDHDLSTQGWVGSLFWRRAFGPQGLYAQGGVRWSSTVTRSTVVTHAINVAGGVVTDVPSRRDASATTSGLGPVAGLGFRFDEKTSLELLLSRQTLPLAAGGTHGGTVLELSLGVHL